MLQNSQDDTYILELKKMIKQYHIIPTTFKAYFEKMKSQDIPQEQLNAPQEQPNKVPAAPLVQPGLEEPYQSWQEELHNKLTMEVFFKIATNVEGRLEQKMGKMARNFCQKLS